MHVFSQLDSIALERELLDRIDAAHPRGTPGRTLVLVPTTRLAAHLQRRLAERRPAWLGLRVMDFSGLTREILRLHSDAVPHVASDLLLEGLLDRLGTALPHNRWIEFTRKHSGALRSLHETLKDLREAGIEPRIVADCCGDPELAEVFAAYDGMLETGGGSECTDRAGLVRLATGFAAEFAASYQSIFAHGAYEWTGVNLELLREIDRGRELTVLLPAQRGTAVSRFSEAFAVNYLGGVGETSPTTNDGGLRLAALYDEESRPEPAAEDRLSFAHAQGPAAEVKLAVREALRDVAAGCPATEIVLTARSLTPYAAALEEVFEDEGLDWTSSLVTPLRRNPLVRDFLLLLTLVAEDFPRAATVTLLRSALIDWPVLLGQDRPAPGAEQADSWSREAGLIGGIEDWTRELPRWAGEPKTYPGQSEAAQEKARTQAPLDRALAERVADCVTALSDAVETEPQRWGAHAEKLRGLLKFAFRDSPNEVTLRAIESLNGLLDEMTRLETLVRDTDEVTFARMRYWLEQAVDRTQLGLHPRDAGGIRVLDAMQLRGLTFQQVHLLGMNAGLFPRLPREDSILGDTARLEIARKSKRPLGRKLEAADEERLLLAILLGSANKAVRVSWQRADQSGKAKTPSLALRELARLRYGQPDLKRLRTDARHLRSHPAQELEDLLSAPGLLSTRDERLLTILASNGVERAGALAERYSSLVPGLTLLQATESWEFAGPEYDARVGASTVEPALSVSALETLGTCPLRFFFQRVLRVEELAKEPSRVALPQTELGTAVHDLLERIYMQLRDEGLFEEDRSVDLVERGLELLDQHRDELLGERGQRLSRRLPVLWRETRRNWLRVVRSTIDADLRRAEGLRLKLVGVEEQRRERMDLGRGLALTLSARFDRRFDGCEGVEVGDYKTSKKLKERVSPTQMLKGRQLQVPLYRMLAGPDSTVELLGINPEFKEDETRVSFSGFDDDEREESFRGTLRVLLGLTYAGVYPLRAEYHCKWCAYPSACRRHHPPTVDRETRSSDGKAYRDLERKSNRSPNGR